MSVIIAALLVSAQAAAAEPSAAPQAAAPAPKKEKKICKADDITSGSRMARRLCLTEEEWAERSHTMSDSARSGFSGSAQDH